MAGTESGRVLRCAIALTLLFVSSSAAQGTNRLAQELDRLRQGTKFRVISAETQYWYGRGHSLRGDTLLLAQWWMEGRPPRADQDTLRIPLHTIRFLDYSLGSNASKGLIKGAGIGAGAGVILGLLAGGSGESSRGELAAAGGVVLLPVGMIVGALIGASGGSEWHPLPIR